MATYRELKAQIAELREQAEQARLDEKAAVLDAIRALIVEHQLLPADLGFDVPSNGRRKTPVAAKYRDPTSGATWSGRGRTPKWLEGGDRSEYEI